MSKNKGFNFDVKVFGADWSIIDKRKMGSKKEDWREFLKKYGIDHIEDERAKHKPRKHKTI